MKIHIPPIRLPRSREARELSPPSRGAERWCLVAILTVAAVLRVSGLTFGLPYAIARPDEQIIVDRGINLSLQDPNPHFFYYPTLLMYVAWIVYRVLGFGPDRTFDLPAVTGPFLIVRGLTVLAGVLTVWAVYRLGRRWYDREVGLTAAFALAVTYLHVRDSHFGVTDVPMTLFATLAATALVRAHQQGAWSGFAAAGIWAGLGAGTKYVTALFIFSLSLAAFLTPASPTGSTGHWQRRAGRLLVGWASLGMAFILASPFVLLDFHSFWTALSVQWGVAQAGWLGISQFGFVYHPTFSLRIGMGLPWLALAVLGVVIAARRDWRSALVVLSFPAAYFVLIGSQHLTVVRWAVPLLPFAAVTGAVAVVTLIRRLWPRAGHHRATIRFLVILMVASLTLIPSIVRSVQLGLLLRNPDSRVLAGRWITARVPPSTQLGSLGGAHGWALPHFLRARNPIHPIDLAGLQRTTFPVVLLVTSPLAIYTPPVTAELLGALERNYTKCAHFGSTPEGTPPLAPRLYDQQDAFFLPFDLSPWLPVERGGPEIAIFKLGACP